MSMTISSFCYSCLPLLSRSGTEGPAGSAGPARGGAGTLAGGISPRGRDLHGLLVLSAPHPFMQREGREERNSIRLC